MNSRKQRLFDTLKQWVNKLEQEAHLKNDGAWIECAISKMTLTQREAVSKLICSAYGYGAQSTREHFIKLRENNERFERKQNCKLYSINGGKAAAL